MIILELSDDLNNYHDDVERVLGLTVSSTGADGRQVIAVDLDGLTIYQMGLLPDITDERRWFVDGVAKALNKIEDGSDVITSDLDSRLAAMAAKTVAGVDDFPPHVDIQKLDEKINGKKETENAEPYFSLISAKQLDEGDYELNYLIPGIMAEKQPLILAGQFKTLKTSIALDACVSLASGTPFLNEFEIPKRRRVLVLTAESGLATVQETCRRICRSHSITLGSIENLFFCDRVPRLDSPAQTGELSAIMRANGIEVVVADPAYLMIDGDNAGNLFAMGDQLRNFADIAAENNATPILLHHAKKNNLNAISYEPLELQDLAWAGFAEFARQWLLLSRRERYVEGTGEHRLWLSAGGSAGHNGCWGIDVLEGHPEDEGGRQWDVLVAHGQEAREKSKEAAAIKREENAQQKSEKALEVRVRKLRDAFIGVGPSGETKTALRQLAGINDSKFLESMAVLLKDGIAEPIEVNKKGKLYEGFRLSPTYGKDDDDDGLFKA